MSLPRLVPALAIALTILILPVYGQINTPCSPSMITSLSPCINFITNSSANGTSPTSDCCNSLQSLTVNGTDCLCLVVTGNAPFQVPINRTLAISLPSACNMPGVPLQCKASASPAPAPGTASLGPTLSPRVAPSSVPTLTPPALAPESDTTQNSAPTSPTVDSDAPTTNSGIRPVLTPSAAKPSYSLSPSLLLFVSGVLVMKYF